MGETGRGILRQGGGGGDRENGVLRQGRGRGRHG